MSNQQLTPLETAASSGIGARAERNLGRSGFPHQFGLRHRRPAAGEVGDRRLQSLAPQMVRRPQDMGDTDSKALVTRSNALASEQVMMREAPTRSGVIRSLI